MSASPAGGTPGATPNGTPRPPMPRKQAPTDPLMRRKPQRRPVRPPAFAHDPSSRDSSKPQGGPKPTLQPQAPANVKPTSNTQAKDAEKSESSRPRDRKRFDSAKSPQRPEDPQQQQKQQTDLLSLIDAATGEKSSGFTTAKPGNYVDYPVFISKKALMEGIRPHIARFHSKLDINLSDQKEWTRPVRLQRRDPMAPAPGGKVEQLDTKDVEIEEERQKHQLMREQREAQRTAAMAEVAPSSQNPNSKRGGAGKRKVTQVFAKDETEGQRARSQLKYEEALPWHLEDFDNRQSWVGSYEAALSNTYAQLVFHDGRFEIAPLEKWYKFTQKRNFKTEEQMEAERAKRIQQNPAWLKSYNAKQEAVKVDQDNKRATATLFDGFLVGRRVGDVGGASAKKDTADAGEMDFEEDMADDEEDPVFEGDAEETKETEKKIKRDMLQANIFNMKEEKSYDKAEQREKFEKQALKEEGKGVRKGLVKRERNHIYDSDDSGNPYSEKSESEDSGEERKKDEPAKEEAEEKKKNNQPGSGASTKGTNTPSGRKKAEVQRNASSNNLKRAGSPNLSEASGNESSKKKQKKKHGIASNLASGISTPNGPPSRPRSPAINPDLNTGRLSISGTQKKPTAPRGNELKRPRVGGAGSGSEGEGAGSGGEMSDVSRKRIKLKTGVLGSKNASPGGSRAASPNRDATAATGTAGQKAVKTAGSAPQIPPLDEIKKMVPEAGIRLGTFTQRYKPIVQHPETKEAFMNIVRGNFKLYNQDGEKMLKPKK